MKDKNALRKIPPYLTLVLITAAVIWSMSCSKDSNNATGGGGPGPGGGGPGREFVSGDLDFGDSFEHVFDSAYVIPYYCKYHGGPGGAGMSGVVTVTASGSPNKINVSINSSTLPDLDIDLGDTVVWTNNHSGVRHTVESDN